MILMMSTLYFREKQHFRRLKEKLFQPELLINQPHCDLVTFPDMVLYTIMNCSNQFWPSGKILVDLTITIRFDCTNIPGMLLLHFWLWSFSVVYNRSGNVIDILLFTGKSWIAGSRYIGDWCFCFENSYGVSFFYSDTFFQTRKKMLHRMRHWSTISLLKFRFNLSTHVGTKT